MTHSGHSLHQQPQGGGDAGQQGTLLPVPPGPQIMVNLPDYAKSEALSGVEPAGRLETERAPAIAEAVAACSADARRIEGRAVSNLKYVLPRRLSSAEPVALRLI